MAKIVGVSWWAVIVEAIRTYWRRVIFGRPLASSMSLEHRLPILLALPVFASDALSSVAYATEEILLQFENAGIGRASLNFIGPISVAIIVLIVIVSLSYRQAIHLYPSGGGSYSVSRDNLGVLSGLVAAGALIIDYILTVAVSVSSGVEQLTSAFPLFRGYDVLIAILLVAMIALINLRGAKESGWAFAFFAYSFIVLMTIGIVITVYRYATGAYTPVAIPHIATEAPAMALSRFALIFLVLRAFASGCSALTGVEAVSNGVSAFQPPEAKNAAKTLLILMVMLVVLFGGVGFAAYLYGIIPHAHETVISQFAEYSFGGRNIWYYLTTFATLSVLLIAANTSFAGFPRLLAIVAKDGYMPKGFNNLGDRLVYNQGILTLTFLSALLIVVFHAKTNALIPLYAVGVFLCFTLSQLGMVRKARDVKARGWRFTLGLNIFGAIVTGLVTIIQASTKFLDGAWMVVVVLPILVVIAYMIHRHYVWFDKTMTVDPEDYNPLSEPAEPLTVLVLVSSDVHRGILEGMEAGRAIAGTNTKNILRAVHIELDPEKTERLKRKWSTFVEPHLGEQVKLDIIPSPYRWLIEPLMDYLDWADLERTGDRVIVVLPEFETGSWISHFLHNFTARRLRDALLNRPHVTVVSSRYFMRPMAWRLGRGGLVY